MASRIKIKSYKQSRGYCGPACLKMVFGYYGLNFSEKKLAKLTKTSRITGCDEINMVKLARKLGFVAKIKLNSNLNELKSCIKKGIPVIVGWTSPEEGGHYSVIVGFQGNKILIADPHFGKVIKKEIKWFSERWFEQLKDKLIKREVIIISR